MYRIDVLTIFSPKKLCVTDYWLSVVIISSNSRLSVTKVCKPEGLRPLPIDEALEKLREKWDLIRPKFPEGKAIPIFCLHELNPLVEGVRALLLPTLPAILSRQIASLEMIEPIELKTRVGPKQAGFIGKTIIDLSPDRFLVLGNTFKFHEIITTLGDRLSFQGECFALAEKVRRTIMNHTIEPHGSSLLIGGFGAVFGFEAVFLIKRMQGITVQDSVGLLITCVLSFLGILSFLVIEASESHIFAFCPWWALKFKKGCWIIFLTLVIVSPVCFFAPVDAVLICHAFRWVGLLLFTSCAVATFGQIMFEEGLSKRFALIWWLTLISLIGLVPVLDLIPRS